MLEHFKKLTKNNKFLILLSLVALLLISGLFFWEVEIQDSPDNTFPEENIMFQEKTMEDILKDLSPDNPESLSEEKRKELEESSVQLSPDNPEIITPNKKKEVEKLLEDLNP